MDTRPIGVFDSGLGGLTAVRQLRRLLPGEDIVYFGDTGRVPYGSRGHDVIVRYPSRISGSCFPRMSSSLWRPAAQYLPPILRRKLPSCRYPTPV